MIMDCKRCAEDMTAFLDGELSDADSRGLRSHLDACASCADEMRSLKEAADFIESHRNDLEPRPQSWNLVRARISSSGAFPPHRFPALGRWRIATAALALMAALALGYMQYQQIQRRDLDRYMSQYIHEREARAQARSIPTATGVPGIGMPYPDNPFAEVKVITTADNPFRSEER
jgi:anti-sigma factor RsiW